MGLAFEMALVAFRLAYRGDLANEILAHKIVELAKAGERGTVSAIGGSGRRKHGQGKEAQARTS